MVSSWLGSETGLLWDECLYPYYPSLLAVGKVANGKENRVLESVKAGRRLPEARFTNLKVASKGQPSVYGAFSKPAS